MGADKAFLRLGTATLIERAISVLEGVCSEVGIVGDATKFSSYRRAIEDVYAGAGPLGGIHAALANSSSEFNLMLAVDLPFVTNKLLAFILNCAESSGAIVTVPNAAKGFQPLCAVYRLPFAAAAESALIARRYKIDPLFQEVSVRVIDKDELQRAGFSENVFANLNTPEDLKAAERQLSQENAR